MSTKALYILSRTPFIGPRRCRALLDFFGDPVEVLTASSKELKLSKILPSEAIDSLSKPSHLRQLELNYENYEKGDFEMVSILDEKYPQRLLQIADPPVVLFVKGNPLLLNHPRSISIVGTRRPSQYGLEVTQRFIEQMAIYQPHIVSGLAIGIDAMAHRSALFNQLPTTAVMGNGMHRIYPHRHERLSVEIGETGSLITEYDPEVKAEKEHFPMRNRIVAALTDITIVVESKQKGGSMITALLANDYQREVATFPGSIHHSLSKGPHHLIKKNLAHLIESGADLAAIMRWGNQARSEEQLQLFNDLSAEEQGIVDLLQNRHRIHIDDLLELTKMSSGELSLILLQLEMKGCIKALAGSQFGIN